MKGWAAAGALLGALVAVLACAPARWLADAVAAASGGQLLLVEARGTVWSGDALLVLTGGPASRDALVLPDRLSWRLRAKTRGLEVHARQDCCLHPDLRLLVVPGLGGVRLQVAARPEPLAQWPAAWLAGLGAPWNTLQPSGTVRLISRHGVTLQTTQGRMAFTGAAELQLDDMASRVAPVATLGSYRVQIAAQAQAGESAQIQLSTLRGPLQLAGEGQLGGGGAGTRLRFRGVAQAEPGSEAALGNLLNLIGRRQGAASVLTIG